MSDLDSGYNTKAALSAVDVAEVSRETFYQILDMEPKDDPAAMERWTDGVEFLIRVCAEKTESRWEALSSRLAGFVKPSVDWDSQSLLLRTVWQAVARHAVNCIMAGDRDEFQTARENDWRQWVLDQINTT